MTKPTQDKETLREAVAMIVGKHIYGETRSRTYLHVTRPCADEILATMFERLQTDLDMAVAREMCVECIGTGYVEQIAFWGRPCDACRGEGYLIVPLTAFQQENSDG